MSQTIQERELVQINESELTQLQIQLTHLDVELQELCHMLRISYGDVTPERIEYWQDNPNNAYEQMAWKIHHLRQLIHLHRTFYRPVTTQSISITEMRQGAIQYLDYR